MISMCMQGPAGTEPGEVGAGGAPGDQVIQAVSYDPVMMQYYYRADQVTKELGDR